MTTTTPEAHSEVGWAYGVIYDDLRACGCGQDVARLQLVRDTLGTSDQFISPADDTPLAEWFLHLLDGAGLIEHGSSIRVSWLTAKGKRFLAVLNDPAGWAALTSGVDIVGYCPAGSDCPECKGATP